MASTRIKFVALLAMLSLSLSPTVFAEAQDPSIPDLGLPDTSGDTPEQNFKSYSRVAPRLRIKKSGQALAKGLILFASQQKPKAGVIMRDSGELVYLGPGGSNLDVQTLHGQQVLTIWTGELFHKTFAYGAVSIFNQKYEKIHEVCLQEDLFIPSAQGNKPRCKADLHDSQMTDRGTMLVTAYNTTRADLTSKGGLPNGYVLDGQFYEIDVKTGKILFRWSSLKHVPVSESKVSIISGGFLPNKAYDYFHINAVQRLSNGNYVVSGRNTASVYLIDPKNGKVIWQFQGYDGGDFGPMPASPSAASRFSFQHHARVRKDADNSVTVTFFNNNNGSPAQRRVSSGMEWHLNPAKNSSKLVRRLHDPNNVVHSFREGSYQPLSNGNAFISYGQPSVIQEFGPKGDTDVRMTIRFGEDKGSTYRAYRREWHATPSAPPDVAIVKGVGYVSWNGATDVTHYDIHGGKGKKNLPRIGKVKKKGFETRFKIPKKLRKHGGHVQVIAFDGKKRLGRSKVKKL